MTPDAAPTVIRVHPGLGRVRADLRAGALIPRLVHAGDGDCVVALVAAGALLIGGDHVRIDVEVGAGCRLRIEDVGGTVAYGGTGLESGWHVAIRVGAGSLLRWDALPFVVSTGASVIRTTEVDLDEAAVALLRETLVFGRHGELGGSIRTDTTVSTAGRAVLREELRVDGAEPRPGILGRHRVLDTALLVGRRAEGPDDAMQLHGPGTMMRAVGDQTHLATVDAAWDSWASALDADDILDHLDLPTTSERTHDART